VELVLDLQDQVKAKGRCKEIKFSVNGRQDGDICRRSKNPVLSTASLNKSEWLLPRMAECIWQVQMLWLWGTLF